MKRSIAFILLAVAILIGGASVDAKKSSKSARSLSSSSISVRMDEDGDPVIIGHTYRVTMNGYRYDFAFGYGSVDVIMSSKSYAESYGFPWEYDGKTVEIYDGNTDMPMFVGNVSRDGRSIKLNSGYTLKLVK